MPVQEQNIKVRIFASNNLSQRMKRILIFLLATSGLVVLTFAQDSSTAKQNQTIVDRINLDEPGKGSVVIIQDESIAKRLGRQEKKTDADVASDKYTEVSGYRIQLFIGNNQRISKNEAYTKEANVKAAFPELPTYVAFSAPFWRLRAGDFQSLTEAQRMLAKLRTEFPSFGREMSIVKEKVRVKSKAE